MPAMTNPSACQQLDQYYAFSISSWLDPKCRLLRVTFLSGASTQNYLEHDMIIIDEATKLQAIARQKPIRINIIIPFIESLIEYVRQRAARTLDGDKMDSTPLISRHITGMLYPVPKLDSNALWCAISFISIMIHNFGEGTVQTGSSKLTLHPFRTCNPKISSHPT
ncbi:hypothetical protein B0O99DRAFT_377276 [Bisporella sp. PMI_857]|nr:hypothetical protein B0O99DRAFT_377276 [Bisporella sp. PMI_857]